MPSPRAGEGRSAFISRCIPYLRKEESGKKDDYYAAKCYGVWRQYIKSDKAEQRK